MSKKTYESPSLKINVFINDEIITASGVFDEEGRIELPFVPAD